MRQSDPPKTQQQPPRGAGRLRHRRQPQRHSNQPAPFTRRSLGEAVRFSPGRQPRATGETASPFPPRAVPGLAGFVAITAVALLLLAAASAHSAPSSLQAIDDPCATPAASPEGTPVATERGGAIDRVLAAGQRAARQTAEAIATEQASEESAATPDASDCLPAAETPSGEDLLSTAAALLEAATATAAAAATQDAAADTPATDTPAPPPTETAVPTATPEPPSTATPEPPPTDTPAPEPTEPTETGEVTEALPAADIPSTNVQGFSFNLEASLTADLAAVQTEAPVYRLASANFDAAMVAQIAAGLGIEGAVEDRGSGTFAVSGNGELFVTPNLIQYLSPAQPGEGDLPDDARAIEIAREWLRTSNLIQPDLGAGSVVSRDDATGRLVVLFTPVEPAGLLAAYPSITVSIGRGGVVLEVSSRWAAIQRADLYQLRPSEEAWRQVERGQGYIEVDLEGAGFAQGTVISGLVEYATIEIAYTTAGPPGDGQYLVPIFVFTGTLTPEGTDQTYAIRAYVPALAISDTPVGFAR